MLLCRRRWWWHGHGCQSWSCAHPAGRLQPAVGVYDWAAWCIAGQEDNNSLGLDATRWGRGRGLAGSAIPSCIFTFGPSIWPLSTRWFVVSWFAQKQLSLYPVWWSCTGVYYLYIFFYFLKLKLRKTFSFELTELLSIPFTEIRLPQINKTSWKEASLTFNSF